MHVDAGRVIGELRALDARSGGRRVAWTATWARERERFTAGLLAELPGARAETDEAGNGWIALPGEVSETIVVGSHLDCVPDGGWLDGCLGVLAGAEILRAAATAGGARRTLALVDWADEEGARFGHSLLGSSAACGLLDLGAARALTDAEGVPLPRALAEHGVELEAMPQAARRLEPVSAYVELHIEQGPVLEQEGRPACAVDGCLGVRRHRLAFAGEVAHAGATPMALRRDPVLAAARTALAAREAAQATGGLATAGAIGAVPGIPTAVAREARLTLDLRHRDGGRLEALERRVLAAARAAAEDNGCTLAAEPLWAIAPVAFDSGLVALAAEHAGAPPLTSGPLHDAASLQRAGVPAAMIFVRTRGGVSHSRAEDAAEDDLRRGIEALAAVTAALTRGPGPPARS
ncbi:MAG TPA: hydantoinase/carbamoylase family amidase [Solirubrobacteraceae bacterium]|nr:hydantoinase/carbamoylase family amidase [Solirubrobacteraceae bacterium]